jgi:hypothetical protein
MPHTSQLLPAKPGFCCSTDKFACLTVPVVSVYAPQALQFVGPQHLEMPTDFAGDGSLLLAQKELRKLNMFKVGGRTAHLYHAG